jgi:RNA-splicing ligase RtcB
LNDDIWLTIHSGSRNLGKKVCEYWQKIAVKRKNEKRLLNTNLESIETIKAKYPKKEWEYRIKERNSKLKDNSVSDGLEYLEGNDYTEYLNDMQLCQSYAAKNRLFIFHKLKDIYNFSNFESIHTIHNFISFDDMIIRKGAIRSYENELCVIPLNMKDGILICEGKSNPEWNFSAPHGAGRIMSRSEAKRTLNLEDFKEDMKDQMSSSVCMSAIDESPRAYKDSKLIEECIEPTVKIITRIIPIITFKDISENGED